MSDYDPVGDEPVDVHPYEDELEEREAFRQEIYEVLRDLGARAQGWS